MSNRLSTSHATRIATRSEEAFSLVEVVIAVFVVSFCLVAVLGLLPIGMKSNNDSSSQTAAAGLAMAIASDLRAAPVTNIPVTSSNYGLTIPVAGGGASTRTFYLSEDGTTTASATALNSRYQATVTITPPASGLKSATAARILLSWPPGASPTNATSFESVIYLNRN